MMMVDLVAGELDRVHERVAAGSRVLSRGFGYGSI